MKIYDIDEKTEILNPDLTTGRLEKRTKTEIIPAVEGVEEQYHFETIAEYPNGGKDVRRVIDVPAVEAQPEREEAIEYFVYIPYSDSELQSISAQVKIAELRAWFNSEYRYLVEKYQRFSRLGITDDATGKNALILLSELDEKAEKVRAEINELEALTALGG